MTEELGNQDFAVNNGSSEYKEIVDKHVALIKKGQRLERMPSESKIPPDHLLAIGHFIDDPDDTFAFSEPIQQDVSDDLDLRFILQTGLNYLLLRNLQGISGSGENEVMQKLMDFSDTDDPTDAVDATKKAVRKTFESEDIEPFLPDNNEPEMQKERIGFREAITVAKLVMAEEEDKNQGTRPLSPIYEACARIIESGNLANIENRADSYMHLSPGKIRRMALLKIVNAFSDDEKALHFFDNNDPSFTPLINYLEKNRDVLAKLFLNNLDTGRPMVFANGELVKMIEILLKDSPESVFLLEYARSIEHKMQGPLSLLFDPQKGDYRDSVIDYLESDKKLKVVLDELNNEDKTDSINDNVGYQDLSFMMDRSSPKAKILERQRSELFRQLPEIEETIKKALEIQSHSGLNLYTHEQAEEVFLGKSRKRRLRIEDEGYLDLGFAKDEYHPGYSPENAMALYVFDKYYGKLNSQQRKTVIREIKRALGEQVRKKTK